MSRLRYLICCSTQKSDAGDEPVGPNARLYEPGDLTPGAEILKPCRPRLLSFERRRHELLDELLVLTVKWDSQHLGLATAEGEILCQLIKVA